MNTGNLFRELSAEPTWASQSRRVRWLAARFYAGVDSLATLRGFGSESPCHKHYTARPMLTREQIQFIIDCR